MRVCICVERHDCVSVFNPKQYFFGVWGANAKCPQKLLDISNPASLDWDHAVCRTPAIDCLHVRWCNPCESKKTIRGLLGSWGAAPHGASARRLGPSSESLPYLKTVRGIVSPNYIETRGPFLCCYCHACPVPFSCLTASPCPLWKCAN